MTIEEIVENLITIRNKLCSRKYETESTLTFDGAIEIMRKYQKIEQIINSNPVYIHHTDMDAYKLNSIRGVVEDGKID